jgi:hypothetical protein
VCRAPVFYYQSPSGGRVFFDHLGHPWPKHPCTSKPSSFDAEAYIEYALGVHCSFDGRVPSYFELCFLPKTKLKALAFLRAAHDLRHGKYIFTICATVEAFTLEELAKTRGVFYDRTTETIGLTGEGTGKQCVVVSFEDSTSGIREPQLLSHCNKAAVVRVSEAIQELVEKAKLSGTPLTGEKAAYAHLLITWAQERKQHAP